ncbi:hypothetical protein PSE_4444 [Pseudovibrio sp. FO-BEG1]|nr:hypothetical protein PSE_4444 [Pseudovibrio sp. FO-BEG1]
MLEMAHIPAPFQKQFKILVEGLRKLRALLYKGVIQ